MFFIVFRKSSMEKGGKKEKHRCEREALIGCLLYVPLPAIIGAQTGDGPHKLSVVGRRSNQLSHTNQGKTLKV